MSAFESFPLTIGWEFTRACNLRCQHCASAAGTHRANELTTEEALNICDQFPALLVQDVDLTGGEPLLRKDWPIIASHLRAMNITVNILTNGYRLERSTVREIKEAGISNVGISLDGLQAIHDRTRGINGSYKQVLKSIEMILQEKLGLVVITTVNNLNIQELPSLRKLLAIMKVTNWRLQPLIPVGRALDYKDLAVTPSGIIELGKLISSWTEDGKPSPARIICADGLEYIEGTEDPQRKWNGCPGGIVACGITSDGKVKTCLSLPEQCIEGDLRQQDLWDIWFSPQAFAASRYQQVGELGANCAFCDKGLECRGGCSANSYAATGSYHNDPYCYYKLSRAEFVDDSLPDTAVK